MSWSCREGRGAPSAYLCDEALESRRPNYGSSPRETQARDKNAQCRRGGDGKRDLGWRTPRWQQNVYVGTATDIEEHSIGMLNGTYEPEPVRRVEIPKPDGGVRKLGIPTVLDRFIQQAVMQVLQRQWDRTFSDHSYGFRPGRSAHQAVAQAQQYIAEGHGWCVDLDLEKFFDRVSHDKLMGQIAKRIEDKRLLKLIRAFLNAGVMENGLVSPSVEGTPQGGPLSPLLSNLVLDELDRELERRGHRFVRYADDCNIYVSSERAGQRVLESITRFITQ